MPSVVAGTEASADARPPNAEAVGPKRAEGNRSNGRRRDRFGRFAKKGRRVRPPRPRRSGIRGRSYYANKSPLELARLVVKVEAQIGRLKAEEKGKAWSDPESRDVPRLRTIQANQTAKVGRRLEALDLVLDELSLERLPWETPKVHEKIANRVAEMLGEPFSWRTLYRKPYFGRWQKWRKVPTTDWIGREETDGVSPALADRVLLGKRRLEFRLRKLTAERDDLRERRRKAMASDSEADGWEPIPQEGHAEESPVDEDTAGDADEPLNDARGRRGRGRRASGA